MTQMLDVIKNMLVAGVDSERVLLDTAGRFYETIEDHKREHRLLEQMLYEYETLEAYFAAENDRESLGLEEEDLLLDMKEDIEFYLQLAFDQVEDDVKHELLHGKASNQLKEDVKAKGILIDQRLGRIQLTEDELEELYIEAFQQFDFLRQRIVDHIMAQSPKAFYDHGKAKEAAYREQNGLLMDAREFNAYFVEHLDKERLWKLLAHKVYETIHYGQRYVLEEPMEEDDLGLEIWQEESEDEASAYEASQKDGVLVPAGDLEPERYTFVYELMAEYTGRRVMASENEYGDEAYWTTYADDFAELLGLYMIAQLENTIRYFSNHRAIEYETFAKMYHWNQEQRENPEVVLTCDKISYYLADLQEALWNEFTESKLMPMYEAGRT
jgi:hypothetical protein